MKEHSDWEKLFDAYKHFKDSKKEHIDSARAQLKLMANRYLTTIKSLDERNYYVKKVLELLESLLPTVDSGNYKEIARLIDAIGKERISLPHKRGFFEILFGLNRHNMNQQMR